MDSLASSTSDQVLDLLSLQQSGKKTILAFSRLLDGFMLTAKQFGTK